MNVNDQIMEISRGLPKLIAGQVKLEDDMRQMQAWFRELQGTQNRRSSPAYTGAGGQTDRTHLAEAMGNWFIGLLAHKQDRIEKAAGILGISVTDAMQEDDSGEGGYLIPTPLLGEVLIAASTSAAIRPISRTLPMTSKTLAIPAIDTKPSVGIVDEEGAIGVSEPAIGQKILVARKICALATLTLELQQDSAVDVGNMLFTLFAEAIGSKEDQQALEGTGTTSDFEGILTCTFCTEVTTSGGLESFDKLIDTLYSLPASAIQSANWIMHPLALASIAKLRSGDVTTGLGPYLFSSPAGGSPGTLLGRPIRLSDQISTTRGGGSDTVIYVGDFGRGMVFGDRMRASIGINPFAGWANAQISVRVVERVGIVIGVPSYFAKLTGITL